MSLKDLFNKKPQQEPITPIINPPRYYQRITELPLKNFIDCDVDGNLSALIISGFPTPEQLHEAWVGILEEDSSAAGDSDQQMYIALYKEVTLLDIDYRSVHALVKILTSVHSEKFENELNFLLKTNFKFNYQNQEEYLGTLQRCLNRSKSIKINLDIKSAQFEALKKKHEGGEKASREYYATILIRLSNQAGYRIDDSITVFEFRQRIKDYNSFMKKNQT